MHGFGRTSRRGQDIPESYYRYDECLAFSPIVLVVIFHGRTKSSKKYPKVSDHSPSNQKTARPLHISLQQFSGGRLVGRSSVMWSVGRFVSLFHSVILVTICVSYAIFRPLSFLTFISCYFLFLKGAEDDLRKVTDLAYKQVSYHFPQLRIIDVRKGSLI